MLIGWTTVETRPQALALARELIARKLAVCAQIEGPITSVYRWQDQIEESTEFRLMVKLLPDHLRATESWLLEHHPYDTPEWIVVQSEHVAEKYLSWAQANSSSLSL
jgi:periplasmic divalent cation tolerance protein